MKSTVFKTLTLFALISLFSYELSAVGLQDYLQNTGASDVVTQINSSTQTLQSTNTETTSQLKNIIELVVAGIVASALIISVLVIFLGRWLANKEKRTIKKLRIEAEEDKENITSASVTIREQEKETTQLIHAMRNQATEISAQQKTTEKYSRDIIETSDNIKNQEQEIKGIAIDVSKHMNDIKSYWETQLNDTISHVQKVQEKLTSNLEQVEIDLEKIQQQKQLSQELLQEFLNTHNQQISVVDSASKFSKEVNQNLEQSYEESKSLIDMLQKHKKEAEKSLKQYSEKINTFEEQAYEQFDTSFQVADLARQELTANLDESRKHIESIRRQEEQSHNINAQTLKNLEKLDYSKIIKIANTLDNTQEMFDAIHGQVGDTQRMLDDLKDIEADLQRSSNNFDPQQTIEQNEIGTITEELQTTDNAIDSEEHSKEEMSISTVESTDDSPIEDSKVSTDPNEPSSIVEREPTTIEITDYKMASGDSTPLSFFRNMKKGK